MESLEITDFSRFRTIYNGKNMVYLKKKNCIGVKMQNDQLVSENIFINKTLFCFRHQIRGIHTVIPIKIPLKMQLQVVKV